MSEKSENVLQTTSEAIATVVKEIPIYQDAVQPTAKALGKGLGGVFLWAMQPFIRLGMNAEEGLKVFGDSLESKTKNIPDKDIVTPNPLIVAPIISALGYSWQESSLRNLFTNLLATSMDSKTMKIAHPAFVEIIKQLSTDEAKILEFFAKTVIGFRETYDRHGNLIDIKLLDSHESIPIIEVRENTGPNAYMVRERNVSMIALDADCLEKNNDSYVIENLTRLGIFDLNYEVSSQEVGDYDRLEQWARENYPPYNIVSPNYVSVTRGVAKLTTWGHRFLEACVVDRNQGELNA